jgi:thiol-disulfide isomerase/thioredoxin
MRMGLIMLAALSLMGCQKKETPQAREKGPSTEMAATAQSAPPSQVETVIAPDSQDKTTAIAAATLPTKLGDSAYPLVGLTWVKGGPVTITPGKVYVVEFWATWCPPCKRSIPHLTSLQKEYKDKGVVFVGVSNEPVKTVQPFVTQQGDNMNYNVASDTQGQVLSGYMTAFQRDTIPTAFIVDKAGKVVWVGNPLDDVFQKEIDKTLAAQG